MESDAARTACGARSEPVRKLDVISSGQPTIATRPGMTLLDDDPKNCIGFLSSAFPE